MKGLCVIQHSLIEDKHKTYTVDPSGYIQNGT